MFSWLNLFFVLSFQRHLGINGDKVLSECICWYFMFELSVLRVFGRFKVGILVYSVWNTVSAALFVWQSFSRVRLSCKCFSQNIFYSYMHEDTLYGFLPQVWDRITENQFFDWPVWIWFLANNAIEIELFIYRVR